MKTTLEDKELADGAVALVKERYAAWKLANYAYPEPVLTAAKVAAQVGLDLDVSRRRRAARIALVWARLEAAVRRGTLGRSHRAMPHHPDYPPRHVIAYDDPEVTR